MQRQAGVRQVFFNPVDPVQKERGTDRMNKINRMGFHIAHKLRLMLMINTIQRAMLNRLLSNIVRILNEPHWFSASPFHG